MAGLPRLGFLLTPFLGTQPDFEGESGAFRKEQQFPRFMPLHGVASAATPTTNPRMVNHAQHTKLSPSPSPYTPEYLFSF